jgi:D-3-phosphoglycerate dehydrogenase
MDDYLIRRRNVAGKVVITDHTFSSITAQQEVIEGGGFELAAVEPNCTTEEDVISNCADADVLLVQWAPISRRVLESLPKVRCVVRYGIGVDNVDLGAAKALGVTVANVPEYCVEEVSDHAMAMILPLCRRMVQMNRIISDGGWGIGDLWPIPRIAGLTLGLIGFGNIARRLAQKAGGFGFHVIAFDPLLPDSVFVEEKVERTHLDRLIETSDVVSLHCPLVPETRHLINKDAIDRMKPGVVIINTARGAIVNEQDLVEGLQSGRISGAGLDVFEAEPLQADSPLRTLPNVILTPHIASASVTSGALLPVQAAEAARDFLQGKRPRSTLV